MASTRVLVVEDQEDIRLLLTMGLGMAGFFVEAVSNGLEAMEYLHSHVLPDAIIVDLRMPLMDGERFCEERKNDAKLRRVPVVIYSNESDAAGIARRLAAEACVAKCAPLGTLVRELERVLH